jgi:hypothetical protein
VLGTWLDSTTLGLGFKTLSPTGWFTEGHGYGNYIWAPSPAAVDVVVEQLGKARLKRPELMHLIVVPPHLMTGRWRRHLGRGSDMYFKIKDCSEVWELSTQFEPLLIFVCLPYVTYMPKLKERQELLDEFQGGLPREEFPEISSGTRRTILCKLLESERKLCPLPGGMVPTVLHTNGDHVVPGNWAGGR